MRFVRHIIICACALLAFSAGAAVTAKSSLAPFVQKYCSDCHDADSKKGNLDLTALPLDLRSATNFSEWVKVHDKLQAGEMPPKKRARPDPSDLAAFESSVSNALTAADVQRLAEEGRATRRRLNRYEYEETLRDLLSLPDLQVKAFLPEDSEAFGFNKVGDALDVSHVQMARYLSAADYALHEAMAPQARQPHSRTNRYYAWDQKQLFGKIHLAGPLNRRTFPLTGLDLRREFMAEKVSAKSPLKKQIDNDPALRDQEAMAVVVSTYEPTEIQFDRFRAPVTGRYHLTFSAYSIWMSRAFNKVTAGHRSEPITIYADSPPRLLRKLASFDVNPDPTRRDMTVWLHAGETIRPDAARFFRSRPPDFKNPLETSNGMPGVAFQWMQVEGPLIMQWPPVGHQLLFGKLPMTNQPDGGVEVFSKNPSRDAKKLLRNFMERAYRHPVQKEDFARFDGVIQHALDKGFGFTDSMIAGYTAVLTSPGFLYFDEKPGRLDDLALAERLSYFLWNSMPDAELRRVAEKKQLHRPAVLDRETERMLNDPRSRRFVNAFLDYWLDLRLIDGTAPDAELYPDYQLDDLLVESITAETQDFFAELLRRNLGIKNLVSSDFAMLNERLARHYGIPGVHGVALRPVELPLNSVRGGLLTQASILKVTANGTTTSPVKRGAWIMARVLGEPPPPPPPNVSAIEPDIRGATTIREQLARHRSQATCAACHRNIDPAGFALESFDVMGAFRKRYRSTGAGDPVKGVGHNGLLYKFCLGQPVDPSGELPNGEAFKDVRDLKKDLLQDPHQLALNLARQLTVYATGAPIGFSDRPKIEQMLTRTQAQGYPVRSLIHQVVQSELFLNK